MKNYTACKELWVNLDKISMTCLIGTLLCRFLCLPGGNVRGTCNVMFCSITVPLVLFGISARMFLLVDLQTLPPTLIFLKVEKKISKIIFLFYPPTLNIICFVDKNHIFLRFCLCILRVTLLKVIVLSRFLGK